MAEFVQNKVAWLVLQCVWVFLVLLFATMMTLALVFDSHVIFVSGLIWTASLWMVSMVVGAMTKAYR